MEHVKSIVIQKPEVVIYTDGGCKPNPGPGAFGAVLIHPRKRLEVSGGFRRTTNNRMEIYAAISGLQLLKTSCRVRLFSDSQYLVNAMMQGWAKSWQRRGGWKGNKERAANFDLWLRLLDLCEKHEVEFSWVRGHAGNVENERCDALSSAALAKPNLPLDEGYEKEAGHNRSGHKQRAETALCAQCGTVLVRITAQKQTNGASFLQSELVCPKCGASYTVEAAQVGLPKTISLFPKEG